MSKEDVEISKEWLELKFKSVEELVETKLKAIEEARRLALSSMEKRLDGMNEFRQSLNDMRSSYITRETYDSRHEAIMKEVDELRLFRAAIDSKASQNSVYISYVVSALAIIGALVALFEKLAK
jgi:hypothetical protein